MKKKFYKSKTFWGLVIAVVGQLLYNTDIIVAGLALTSYGFRDAMK